MKIEVLYVSGCPNHPPVIKTIAEVLRECGLQEQITEIEVTGSDAAVALEFPGSPTIRIDGTDIEPDLHQANSYGLMCRTYIVDGKPKGVPRREWIRDAIMRALNQQHE